MSIKLTELTSLLKTTKFPVFRDSAPERQLLPYIIYSYISEDHKRASGAIYRRLTLYQVSLFTKGNEKDFLTITKKLNENKIPFSPIVSIQGNENDDTVTNFFTRVRCIEDV